MAESEGVIDRVAGDQLLRQSIQSESDPIKKVARGLKEYIPVGVTSFYLTFYTAAADTPQQVLVQHQVLPVLSLIATIILSWRASYRAANGDIAWGGVVIPPLALVGWIYVTGGQFFTLEVPAILTAIAFAFLSLLLPAGYALSHQ